MSPVDTPPKGWLGHRSELRRLVASAKGLLQWQRETLADLAPLAGETGAKPRAATPSPGSTAAGPRPAPAPRPRAGAAAPARSAPPEGLVLGPIELPGPGPAAERLAQLRAQVTDCGRCGLATGRRNVVFGSGAPEATVMFVGEGPGANEDAQGEPFVGAAGALLDAIIEKGMGLRRAEVYVANVVKCRPPQNRDPLPPEVVACMPVLQAQLAIVQPQVVVALGRVAAQALLDTDAPLNRLRGAWHELAGRPLRVTFHPAYLLRYPERKRQAWEDVQAVMARLGLQRPTR